MTRHGRASVLLAITAASALAITGCSSAEGDETTTLRFVLSGDATQQEAMETMAEQYQEETGVEVEIVVVPSEDLTTSINSMIDAGNPPNAYRGSYINPAWFSEERFLDLSSVAADADLPEELVMSQGSNGEIYGIPFEVTAVGLYINQTLFDEAGVSYPTSTDEIWSWDEYLDAIAEVQEATGSRYQMVMDRSSNRVFSMIYQFGSDGITPDEEGVFTFDDKATEPLELFLSLNDDVVMPRSVWLSGEDPVAMFKTGQIPALYSGSWNLADFAANITDFEWRSVYLPMEERRSTNMGRNGLYAFDTDQNEATIDFVTWLMSAENYTELAELSGFLSITEGIEPDYEYAQDSFDVYASDIQASLDIATQSTMTFAKYNPTTTEDLGDPLRDALVQVLNNEITLDEAMSITEDRYTEVYGPGVVELGVYPPTD